MKVLLAILIFLACTFAVMFVRGMILKNRHRRQCNGKDFRKTTCPEDGCNGCPFYSGRS